MTRDELRLRLDRLLREFAPPIRNALLAAFAAFVASWSPATLARALTDVESLVGAFREQLTRFRESVREAARKAASRFRSDLPRRYRVGIAFDVLNPRTLAALERLDTRVMRGLLDGLRATVRQAVADGLTAGQSPLQIARGLRELLPLAPNQAAAVRNFERMLRAGDAEALTRALRDRRFDRTLKRAFAGEGLTEAQIRTMTAAYRRRMIAWNAETISRTATLDALRAGQRASWDAAIANGIVDANRLMKERVTVGDSRVREEHAAINGEIVPFDMPYSNGELVSGDQSYNCRCVDRVFVREWGVGP